MGMFQSIVVLIISIYLIGGVYLLHCPTYLKHEALRDNLLNDRAICRAQNLRFEEELCLNGLKPTRFYCATEGCNTFGYNCNGHCLSGDDIIVVEDDFDSTCNITRQHVLDKLCSYYQDQFDAFNDLVKLQERNIVRNIILPPPEITGISSGIHPWNSAGFYSSKLKKLCPKLNLTRIIQ